MSPEADSLVIHSQNTASTPAQTENISVKCDQFCPATSRRGFKTLFKNTAINRRLPVGALEVNEKDAHAAVCKACILKKKEKPKQMFSAFVTLPIISP